MRRFATFSAADVLWVIRTPDFLGGATSCLHTWRAAIKRFDVQDLGLQQQLHLTLTTAVLLRRLNECPVLTVRSDYQQQSFGFIYDVSLHCEARNQAVRGYALKRETEKLREDSTVMIVEHSGHKDVTQVSEPTRGVSLDDVQSYCRSLGIHVQYRFDGDQSLAFFSKSKEAPGSIKSLSEVRSVVPGAQVSEEQCHYACTCSLEGVLAFVKKLPKSAVEELIATGGKTACKFCNQIYQLPLGELDALLGDPYKRYLGL